MPSLGVPSTLTAVLAARGITTPRPIQAHTVRDGLAGRDVLGRAETGSGKTLAFGLPVLVRTATASNQAKARKPWTLVLVLTRELADQVRDELVQLGAALGLRLLAVYGGVPLGRQVQQLRRGIDIIVATPGRPLDLLRQGACSLDAVAITVLDDADHMADMGFLPDVTSLLDRVPPGGQRLLFSATLDGQVDTLVRRYLSDPVRHTVAPTAAAAARMDHQIRAGRGHRQGRGRGRARRPPRPDPGVRAHQAPRRPPGAPARSCRRPGWGAARQPGPAGQSLGPGRLRHRHGTGAGGHRHRRPRDPRGRIDLVMHFDPPAEPKAYLHRSGRTARAGATGTVITLALPEQASEVARTAPARPQVTTSPVPTGPRHGHQPPPAAPQPPPRHPSETVLD